MNPSLYQNISTTTLLTAKLQLRLCNSLAFSKKSPWQEEPLNVKEKSFLSALHKQTAITQPSMVLFKICKHHLVQHVILIQMVYERSRGHKMADHWKRNAAGLMKKKEDDSSLYHN